jgi:hypothetical protein
MTAIEDLVAGFSGLPSAAAGRWNVAPLVAERVYMTRDEFGRFAIFLLGEEPSFGTYPRILGIEHSPAVVAIPAGPPFPALLLRSSSLTHGNRIMAHIAYELERRIASDASVTNAALIGELGWILELLSEQEGVMTGEEQKGLVGELVLLRKLLALCKELGLTPSEALGRWWGWDKAKRDFVAAGTAIEVKTTSKKVREHYIGSVSQLDPQNGEEVYVCSLGVRLDPTAARKLPAFVEDVAALITKPDDSPDQDALESFFKALREYGYDDGHRKLYDAGPGFMGFHLPPKLFREADLDRVRLSSFKTDRFPRMVNEVMYLLQLQTEALAPAEEREVLTRLLTSPATTVRTRE